MNKTEIESAIATPRRYTTATVLENIAENSNDDSAETINATALSSIAINLAELTDKVCELTAYMMGFCEWAREQKQK